MIGRTLATTRLPGRSLVHHRGDHCALRDLRKRRWSRDGNYVYFERFGRESVYLRARITDRTVEQIASLKGVRQASWLIPPVWTGLAPDDSLLVLREVGPHEIYTLDWEAP